MKDRAVSRGGHAETLRYFRDCVVTPRRRDQEIVSELADGSRNCKWRTTTPPSTSRDARPDFWPSLVVCGVCLAPNQHRDTSAVCKIPCHLPSESPSSSPRCGFLAANRYRRNGCWMAGAGIRGSKPGSYRLIRYLPRRSTGCSESSICGPSSPSFGTGHCCCGSFDGRMSSTYFQRPTAHFSWRRCRRSSSRGFSASQRS